MLLITFDNTIQIYTLSTFTC